MGHHRAFAALILIATLTAATAPPLSEARWIAPARQFAALTRQPAECFRVPLIRDEARLALIGRAAFRAPLLLGGQAARAGLSCASCHRNGRGNPDFRFPGLSGADGTADVTSSLISSHRGNGVFDPKPIPDLARDAPKISRDHSKPDLRTFIHGLITQEFDGVEPPPRVLDGLTVYVRSLGTKTCAAAATQPITLAGMLEDARKATTSAREAWQAGDAETARLMIGAARSTLGRIDERYAGPMLKAERARIAKADQALFVLQQEIDARATRVPALINAWLVQSRVDGVSLRKAEGTSLFNAKRLAARLR